MNIMTFKTSKIVCVVAVVMAGFMQFGAFAQSTTQTECPPAAMSQGTSTNIGTFYAMAKMTNGLGTFWVTPPANTQSGTFSDASGFQAPYSSSVIVTRRNDGHMWFATNNNSITFQATNSSYSLTVYINSTPPPPTNGQAMTLQVIWTTNSSAGSN